LGKPEQLASDVVAADVDDLLLVTVVANEAALSTALLALLSQSKHYAGILDATKDSISRKDLARRTKIDTTNIAKFTGPLTKAGWVRQVSKDDEVAYQRSRVVDMVLQGRSVREWVRLRAALGETIR
jgi:DNA-binding MarR family transcriptional regulator